MKNFRRRKEKKALFIYDTEDYLGKIKVLEAVFDDLDFNIIRIDPTEKKRNAKLNEIAEAFQSNRISSLDEKKSEKLKIIEKIVNNNPSKMSQIIPLNVI